MKFHIWGNKEEAKPTVSPSTPTTGTQNSVEKNGENKRKLGIKLWWSRKSKAKKETGADEEDAREMLDANVEPAVENTVYSTSIPALTSVDKETGADEKDVKEMLEVHVGPAVETPPWVEWTKQEGQDFCRKLEKWREDHPNDLNNILEKIRKTFLNFGQLATRSDAVKDLLSAIGIPGFPAGFLIQGVIGVAVFAAV
ncbi:hypothetical protein MSAN_00610900 [Mycena sanguinolenta]|uniref:Uncharacterized protein n=1 Tax=Mycena sanguinolenta TaxID=230812 RepID=A0A8H6ZBT3_9AGAR|nr:hypothetical protein MSAN_00610900 [Mycena sanguinolenta]